MQLKGSGTIKKHQTKKYFHSLTDKRRSTSTRNILISNFKLDEYILNFLPINLKSFCRGVLICRRLCRFLHSLKVSQTT